MFAVTCLRALCESLHRKGCIFAVLAMVVLAGCVAIDDVELMPGVFRIATPASGFINSESRARVILDERARMLCRAKYQQRAERVIEDAHGRKSVIWEVACN